MSSTPSPIPFPVVLFLGLLYILPSLFIVLSLASLARFPARVRPFIIIIDALLALLLVFLWSLAPDFLIR